MWVVSLSAGPMTRLLSARSLDDGYNPVVMFVARLDRQQTRLLVPDDIPG
jgi:hypothetical protein